MKGAGGWRDPGLRPIFVVGLPRSGSTLIEQVLASHSQVAGAGVKGGGAGEVAGGDSLGVPAPCWYAAVTPVTLERRAAC